MAGSTDIAFRAIIPGSCQTAAPCGSGCLVAGLEQTEMRSGHCRKRLTRVLAAALCTAVALAPAARGADATQCPEDNPLGGWIRYQSTYHFQPIGEGYGGTGCDSEYTQYLRLDMLQMDAHITRATIEATLPPSLKGSARETILQQMLNSWGKHTLLDPYHVSRIHYQDLDGRMHQGSRRHRLHHRPGGPSDIRYPCAGRGFADGISQEPEHGRVGGVFRVLCNEAGDRHPRLARRS